MAKTAKARFIEPMLLVRTDALPDDRERWQYELKVDGYRAIAFKTAGKPHSAPATTTTSRSVIRAS